MTTPETTEIASRKPTLTDRLRQIFFPVIDPIVTVLAHWKLSPDVLTILGMLAHFILAALIALGQVRWAGVGLILIAPLDALDGSLARKLGRKQGGFGAFLDSTLDRLAEIILYGGFIYYYYYVAESPRMLAIAYLAVSGSLMVSYARARAESLGLDCKVGFFSRVERYVVLIIFLLLGMPDYALIILAAGTYFTLAHRIFHVLRQAAERDGQ